MFEESEKLFVKCEICNVTMPLYVSNVWSNGYICDKCMSLVPNEGTKVIK